MTSRACFEPSIFAKNGPPDLEGCSSLRTLGKMRILVCLTLRVRPLSLLVHGVQAYEGRYLVVDKRSDHQGPACYRVTKHAECVECPWDITKCILSFRSPHILTSRRSEHISDRSACHTRNNNAVSLCRQSSITLCLDTGDPNGLCSNTSAKLSHISTSEPFVRVPVKRSKTIVRIVCKCHPSILHSMACCVLKFRAGTSIVGVRAEEHWQFARMVCAHPWSWRYIGEVASVLEAICQAAGFLSQSRGLGCGTYERC